MRDPPLILIVDDNADNREILEARLESQGYATATAVDGEEALAAARELGMTRLLGEVEAVAS